MLYVKENDKSREWFLKGKEFGDNKQYSEVIEYYNKALEINPTNFDALIYRGVDYYKINQYNLAGKDFDLVISTSTSKKDKATALKNKGNLFFV